MDFRQKQSAAHQKGHHGGGLCRLLPSIVGPCQLLPLSYSELVLRAQPCLRALESICTDAGYSTKVKMVLTSEGNRRTDLEVLNIRVTQQTDLLVDVILRHDFIGAGRDGGQHHGKLRNPDDPDHILESAAAEKIRKYSDPYRQNRQFAFLPACLSTSGRIHGEFLHLLFFLANKKADDYFEAL
jgi:hypothetical protein